MSDDLQRQLESAQQLWALYVRRAMRPPSAKTLPELERKIARLRAELARRAEIGR